MKEIYLELKMGAAGDMIMAALFELIEDKERFLKDMNGLMPGGFVVQTVKAVRAGIAGTGVTVLVDGREEIGHNSNEGHEHRHEHGRDGHGHRHLEDINKIIGGFNVSESVKRNALAVYRLLAEAEAEAHGKPADMIHFHEVGELDAIADITGVCILLDILKPDRISASPVNAGGGAVKCAHGIMPVPAPAAAALLRGIPSYGTEGAGELCTPTGAALIKYFVTEFGAQPVMKVAAIGVGAGHKEFESANVVRAFMGETGFGEGAAGKTRVCEICCETDDMSGEHLAYACEIFRAHGALDVFISPVYMKKNRPGNLITVLCKEERKDEMAALMLKHTSSFGVRVCVKERYELNRRFVSEPTMFGDLRIKHGFGFGVDKAKIEFEDAARLASSQGISITELYDKVQI